MTDLVQRICAAIFRQEGRSADHHNPGNLRDCPWFEGLAPFRDASGKMISRRKYADGAPIAYNGSFWEPRTRAEGVAGAFHVVALHVSRGESLRRLISIWAPAIENPTAAYIANVSNWASIPDVDVPLWNLLVDIPT